MNSSAERGQSVDPEIKLVRSVQSPFGNNRLALRLLAVCQIAREAVASPTTYSQVLIDAKSGTLIVEREVRRTLPFESGKGLK